MNYELISDQEYANLPNEDGRCFVEFENICQRNMNRLLAQKMPASEALSIREQYMASVASVAQECHVPNIRYDPDKLGRSDEFERFSLAVRAEVARIRIRSRGMHNPYSVLLTDNTREKIKHYISRIRNTIEQSDLDSTLKNRLQGRLDQLTAELGNRRLSFAKTMAFLAGALAVGASSTTIAADGQKAVAQIVQLIDHDVAQIMQLIGHDKETEDAAALRLTPPPKALPAPPAKTAGAQREPMTHTGSGKTPTD